jgi:hypothetical protein
MPDLLTLPEALLEACQRTAVTPTPLILTVSVASQTLSVFEDQKLSRTIPCSTSRFGIGEVEGSNCTPLGLHRIREKIGAGQPAGTVFRARQIVGHTSEPGLEDAKITTRILWLEGLEPGRNQGGNVDSHRRYIYIHGTANQNTIGQPTSCGCIHLADAELISLFEIIPTGALVWIGAD